jgi:hypothetical protein
MVAEGADIQQAFDTCFRNSESELVGCCLGIYMDYDELAI